MNATKLAFVAFFLGLWVNTKQFAVNVYGRVRDAILSIVHAVVHIVFIPVHAVQWVWGCLKSSVAAVKGAWKK